MSTQTKRMQLSRDQRAVLEAVYAIEKLPDASLRERLGGYLNLTTRQIQVWFQNRRQRSKTTQPDGKSEEVGAAATSTSTNGVKKPSLLNTSDQILEALFDFGKVCGGVPGAPGTFLPPNHKRALQLDGESFDWALPGASNGAAAASFAGLKGSGSDAFLAAQALGLAPDSSATFPCTPLTYSQPAALSAVLGFVCNILGADACDYFLAGSGEPALAQFFLPAGQLRAAEVSACRAMLIGPLCEHIAGMRELVWFGVTEEQQKLLCQAGTSMQKVLAVPCLTSESSGAAAQAGNDIIGMLVIYSSSFIEPSEGIAILVRLAGALAAAAHALPHTPCEQVLKEDLALQQSYASIPLHARHTNTGWLLLSAAHALGADVAEHWRVHQSDDRGAALVLEQLLANGTVQNSPSLVREIGEAEAAHPFSSQMCHATLYACKLVWCHATAANGLLEGLQLPMHTSVGLPICDCSGGASSSVFVLYSLRRLEESSAAQKFFEQLQMLFAAAQKFSVDAAANAHANTHTVSTPSTRSVCPVPMASVPGQLLPPHSELAPASLASHEPGSLQGSEPLHVSGSLHGAGSLQAAEHALQQLLEQQADLQGQRAMRAFLQPQSEQSWPAHQPHSSSIALSLPMQPPQTQLDITPASDQVALHACQMQELQAMLLQRQHVLHSQRALEQYQALQEQRAAQSSQAQAQTAIHSEQQRPASPDVTPDTCEPQSQCAIVSQPPSRPSSAPPCPVERMAATATVRSAALPDTNCAASCDVVLPAPLLGAHCGTAGFDMSADQVLSLLDDIRWPSEQLDANGSISTSRDGRVTVRKDHPNGKAEAAAKLMLPIDPPAAAATDNLLASMGTAHLDELPKPLPRHQLPKLQPLPLMHSGLSGDLDSLMLPDDLEDKSPASFT